MSKKLRTELKAKSLGNDNDILGNVPELVLTHILSLLPTKDAVRTSVLSTKWRYKWALITNLYFDDSLLYSNKKRKSRKTMFMSFVQRVLLLGNSTIQQFHLSCHKEEYDPKHISTWILAAIRRDAQRIKIICPRVKSLAFPCLTYSCGSLAELELRLSCTIKVPSSICFSSLKIMDLYGVTFLKESNSSSIRRLDFDFNVLEVLSLVNCRWENVIVIKLNAPKLRSFGMRDNQDKLIDSRATCDCLLQMSVPKLTNFECCAYSVVNVVLVGQSAITDLCVEVPRPVAKLDRIQEACDRLLTEFSDAKYLTISSEIIKDDIPDLENLIQLTVRDGKFNGLMALLCHTPVLESLTIDQTFLHNKNADVQGRVPKCVLSHLKVVEFQHVQGKNDGWLKLARFLLSNAMALEKMIISYRGHSGTKVREQLFECPRCSSHASIVFTYLP